jgi:LEA14-like dessication related protein
MKHYLSSIIAHIRRWRIRTRILLGFAIVMVLLLAAGGILYAMGLLRPPSLEGIILSWGEVTERTTTVDTAIEVNNRLPFGLGSGSIGIEVPIYFYSVEAARFDLPSLSLPRG